MIKSHVMPSCVDHNVTPLNSLNPLALCSLGFEETLRLKIRTECLQLLLAASARPLLAIITVHLPSEIDSARHASYTLQVSSWVRLRPLCFHLALEH